MEEMLGQKMRPPLVLAQFLAEYKRALQNTETPHATEADIQADMQLSGADDDEEERFHAAAEATALEHLSQFDDARIAKFRPGLSEMKRKNLGHIPDDALRLNTFKLLLQSKNAGTKSPFKRSHHIFKMVPLPTKRDGDSAVATPKAAATADWEDEEVDEEDVQQPCDFYNDLVLTVRVYRPARATHVGQSLEKPVFAEEFECLGSNVLTDLRDKISCVCNGRRFYDISDNPAVELPAKDLDPGYFFITDTFYNDQRNPNNPHYSETIRMWAQRANGLKEMRFKVAAMEHTRFLDLTVSLGFPQLYQHHGNCEHVFTFSQVEVITPGALCLSRWQYPRFCSFSLYNDRTCNMCGKRNYDFLVEGSERQLHDPAYLCSKCFYGFHYVDGKKVGQFRAYRIKKTAPPDGGPSATAAIASPEQDYDDAASSVLLGQEHVEEVVEVEEMEEVEEVENSYLDDESYLIELEESQNEFISIKKETNEI